MNTSLLYNKLSALPENLKKEVVNFVDSLIAKSNQDISSPNVVCKANSEVEKVCLLCTKDLMSIWNRGVASAHIVATDFNPLKKDVE